MKYELVVRRRERMGTAIAAVGEMLWADDVEKFAFTYRVPEDSEVSPVILVKVDLYENETRVGHGDYLRQLQRGEAVRFVWEGPPFDKDDVTDVGDLPKPPGLVLTFDPNDLLSPVEIALHG